LVAHRFDDNGAGARAREAPGEAETCPDRDLDRYAVGTWQGDLGGASRPVRQRLCRFTSPPLSKRHP
jgi:hypothetical protein